jgi:hypothetical protein
MDMGILRKIQEEIMLQPVILAIHSATSKPGL